MESMLPNLLAQTQNGTNREQLCLMFQWGHRLRSRLTVCLHMAVITAVLT